MNGMKSFLWRWSLALALGLAWASLTSVTSAAPGGEHIQLSSIR